MFSRFTFILAIILLALNLLAADTNKINNLIKYSDVFYSSGQPSKEQLKALSESGFKRIIYLAFSSNSTAIVEEDKVVKELEMSYTHIPVDFMAPTISDFETFAAVMSVNPQHKTLLHCQVNFRASAFSFLYRVIYKKVPMKIAKSDLDAIWEPDSVWFTFIGKVLRKHGFDQNCDDCDWGENEFANTDEK